MGRGRLRADLGRVPDHGCTPRRPNRSAADVLERPRSIHAVLGGMWDGRDAGGARGSEAHAGRWRGVADAERAIDHRRHVLRLGSRPRAWRVRSGYGCRGGLRSADRRRAGAARYRRTWLAQLLSDQRARGCARARSRPAVRSRVARRASQRTRSGRNDARHRRCDRGRAALGRGPPARLAAVDMDLARSRAAAAAGLRVPPAPSHAPRRHAAGRAGSIPGAFIHRRSVDAACVLVWSGVVLSRSRAVPAAGPWTERAARRARVHDSCRGLRGRVCTGAGAHRAPRSAAACRRRARTSRRARPAAGCGSGCGRRRVDLAAACPGC